MNDETTFTVEEPSRLLPNDLPDNGSASLLKHEETAEERIREEIKRFHLPDAMIEEMRKKYSGLKIRPLPAPEDKEGLKLYRQEKEAVREALQVLRATRTGLEKKRKDLKADYLKIGTGIDGEAKRLTNLVVPIEDPLKEAWDAAEAAEEARKNEAERQAQEKLQGRVRDLLEAGIMFDGSFYSLEDISVDVVTLKTLPDDKFTELLSKVRTAKAKLDEAAKEEARKIQEQKAQEEADRKEFQRQQLELQKQQDELKRQKEEFEAQQEKARQEVIKNRRTSLEGLGLTWKTVANHYSISNQSGAVEVKLIEVTESSDDHWATIFLNVAGLVKEIKEKEEARLEDERRKLEEQKALDERTNRRIQLLQEKGFYYNPGTQILSFSPYCGYHNPLNINLATVANIVPEQWDQHFANWIITTQEITADYNKELQEKQTQEEKERQQRLSESERVAEYFARLRAVPRPEISTPGFVEILGDFYSAMDEASVHFEIK